MPWSRMRCQSEREETVRHQAQRNLTGIAYAEASTGWRFSSPTVPEQALIDARIERLASRHDHGWLAVRR